jgi:hypothetical protein
VLTAPEIFSKTEFNFSAFLESSIFSGFSNWRKQSADLLLFFFFSEYLFGTFQAAIFSPAARSPAETSPRAKKSLKTFNMSAQNQRKPFSSTKTVTRG